MDAVTIYRGYREQDKKQMTRLWYIINCVSAELWVCAIIAYPSS